MLIDNHGRPINYLRLAVTDRCNLRCFYCMPEEGVSLTPQENILTLEERYRALEIFAKLGVTKLRLTGGEPTVSKQLVELIRFSRFYI